MLSATLLFLSCLLFAVGSSAQQPAANSNPPKLSPADVLAKTKEFKTCLAETIRLRDAGKLDDAIIAGRKLLEDARELLGNDNPLILKPMEILAIEYQMNEDFSNAESMRREIVAKTESLKKLKKVRFWQVSDANAGLRETLFLKDLDPAKRRELADAEQTTRQSQVLLGQNKSADALKLADRASKTFKRIRGENSRRYATSLLQLAVIYDAMGDYAKAAEINKRAINIDRVVVGVINPDYAVCAQNLGESYRKMGDFADALRFDTLASNTLRNTLGPRDQNYGVSLNNLGALYSEIGDNEAAEPMFTKALVIYRATYGEKSEKYSGCLNNLGLLYAATKNYSKAELSYKLALSIEKDVLGDSSPSCAATLYNLARLYEEIGEDAKAEPVCRQACAIGKSAIGENHPTYAKYLTALGITSYDLGEYDKAESLVKQASAIDERSLGKSNLAYAADLSNLATIEAATGKYAGAAPLAQQALDIARNHLEQAASVGSEHRQISMELAVRFYVNSYLSFAAAAKVPGDSVYTEILAWKGEVSAWQMALRHMRDAFRLKGLSGALWDLDEMAEISRKLANELAPLAPKLAGWKSRINRSSPELEATS